MYKAYEGTLYGTYRTKKFSDVWNSAEDFTNEYQNIGIPVTIPVTAELGTAGTATTLYYLLYARYGNSTVASSDPNQFKYKLFTIIWQYGPSWAKELEIQGKVRALTDKELEAGSVQIYNNAQNPSVTPSTNTDEELEFINAQNVTKNKRSKIEGYALVESLLKRDVTEEFLSKFKKLFRTIVEPELPLLYEEINDGTDNT